MIKENLENIKKQLPKTVTLVAVSKTKPISDLHRCKSVVLFPRAVPALPGHDRYWVQIANCH